MGMSDKSSSGLGLGRRNFATDNFCSLEQRGGGGQLNESYSQPEGEEVSDAQGRQEGMSELPALKRGGGEGWRQGGGGGMKKQDRTFCCTDVRTQGPWVYFHYPGTPRVLRAEFTPLLHTAYLTNRSPEIYCPNPDSFCLWVWSLGILGDKRGGEEWVKAGEGLVGQRRKGWRRP